jgi:hypothetical protein
MSYLGQIIIFLAALIGIKGGTWNKNNKGFKKITITGWITSILALTGLIVAMITTHNDKLESNRESQKLQTTLNNTDSTKNELIKTRILLDSANITIDKLNIQTDKLNSKIEIYQEVISEIKNQSDRQLQQVMIQWVPFKPYEVWRAPNQIYSGSVIKFYGFKAGLVLEYNGKQQQIPEWDGRNPTAIAIFGHSGQAMNWTVKNTSNFYNDGKIQVFSTPRSRSSDWSWIEEKIKGSE